MNESEEYAQIIAGSSRSMEPTSTHLGKSGTLRMPVYAVLFDIYGTLFISGSGDISAARQKADVDLMEKLLQKFGFSRPPGAIFDAFYREIEKAHSQKRDAGVLFPEVEVDKIWMNVLDISDRLLARKFALEYEVLFNPVWPMPGLEEVLNLLHRKVMKMGIISNAQFFTPYVFKAFLGRFPEHLGFEKSLVLYSFKYGHAKPSPVLFRMAEKRLRDMGIKAGEAVFVGNDMRNDIFPAAMEGFQTALFGGDTRSLRMGHQGTGSTAMGPDLIVTNLKELSDYIVTLNEG
ncbi:MAG: HAD family hydrolase [Spirochaetota bacterium]